MKLISFSLWGNNPKYTVGAIRNAELAANYYPGWVCRYYVDNRVPDNILADLDDLENTEVVPIGVVATDWRASFWRFLAVVEDDVDVFLCRDTDSRLSAREVAAVDDWLASDRDFHIMRDHPKHGGLPILGGLWGVRNGILKNMSELMSAFANEQHPPVYGIDQFFLGRFIHPRIRENVLVHDDLSPVEQWDSLSERRTFPQPRDGYEFVGQIFDESGNTVPEHLHELRQYIEKTGL